MTHTDTPRRRMLITGAAGRIGSYVAEHTHTKYDLRLMVQVMDEKARALARFGEVVVADLEQLGRMKEICGGIDTVVHLAGNPSPSATWEQLLGANIIGTYHTFVAAKAARCRRVVFASSIHAISGYPTDVQVKTDEPPNPGDLYGVSKCFGESLGRYMAEQEGLSTIAIRIGSFQPPEAARAERVSPILDSFVSQRDLCQLIERCVDAEHVTFAIAHGLSNNRFKRMDISDTRALLGYDPQDDFAELHPGLNQLNLGAMIAAHNLADKNLRSGLRDDLGETS